MPSLLLPFWPRTSPKVKGPAGLSAGIESARHRPDPVDGGVSQDEEAAAHRMVASLRLVLALAALIVLRIDPPEPARNVPITYFSLALYVVYAAIVCLQASRYVSWLEYSVRWQHWVDLACFTALIASSSGAQSVFFFGYIFTILVAAFQKGLQAGLVVTLMAALLFGSVGYLTSEWGSLEVNRVSLRLIFLVVLGYMISYWGGFHFALTRRLRLLKDVAAISNPRFGVDRTIANVMRRLRSFYDASACVVLTTPSGSELVTVRRCTAQSPAGAEQPVNVPPATVDGLLALDPAEAVIYVAPQRSPGTVADMREERLRRISDTFNAPAFITVPWQQPGHSAGRLYLTSDDGRLFESADVDLLSQVINQISPTLDNIRLVDRLATDAAEAERQRIARDLHDSVVQPYIGIRLGLAAIRQKAVANKDVITDVDHLSEMISLEIDDLRSYLRGLKAPTHSRGAFVDAVARFAGRFEEATGIATSVDVGHAVALNDRLAAETFQMLVEGLSNVRRHTESRAISVRLGAVEQRLRLEIEDRGTAGRPFSEFVPRSIAERAHALGGTASVRPAAEYGSVVTVEIPL